MYYKYDMSKQNNIQRFSNIDNINKNAKLLEIMSEAREKAKEQILRLDPLNTQVLAFKF